MAEYLGKITLINVEDSQGGSGVPGPAGNGILSNIVYFVTSNSNSAPPGLEDALLEVEGQSISFLDVASTFQIKSGVLYATRSGALAPLSIDGRTDGEILTGSQGGWQTAISNSSGELYLWTKTIFTYTNGDQTIVYNMIQNGEPGEPGVPGEPGRDAEVYSLETNQEEILRFYSRVEDEGTKREEIDMLPNSLEIWISKKEIDGTTSMVENLDSKKIKLSSYSKDGWAELDQEIYRAQYDAVNKKIFIDLTANIQNSEYDEEGNLITPEIESFFKTTAETVLKIEYQYDNHELVKYINIRYGMTKDQAILNIYSNAIVSAVKDTTLNFSEKGLAIYNGGLEIFNKKYSSVPVLSFDDDTGNLKITGSGSFSGKIEAQEGSFKGIVEATDGSFNGEITATSGLIGGFTIENNQLVSKDGSLILNGVDSIISAQNIILGTGAEIANFIKIGGNVTLSKPTDENGQSFLTVTREENAIVDFKADGSLNISGEGTIKIGNSNNYILLNGADGTISSSNYTGNTGWFISNQEAIFNNVTIRGSIKSFSLEYGEASSVGGILLVRPSSKIITAKNSETSENNIILTLEETTGFTEGDTCLITLGNGDTSKIYGTIININSDKKTIELELTEGSVSDLSFLSGKVIVSFGYITVENTVEKGVNNIGIGINGSTDNSLIPSQSISVFEMNKERELVPHIILGKLPNDQQTYGFAAGTYGLYAENVLLKGSLVTQTKTGDNNVMYSGISTLYTAGNSPTSNKYSEWFGNNTGEILLWAGAEGTSKEQVENSKFFVDRNGNLYAGSGYFEGTIITKATIQASKIETAEIQGIGDTPALTISDASTGIKFFNGDKDVFVLDQNKVDIRATLGIIKPKLESEPESEPKYAFQSNENGETIMSKVFVDNYEGRTLVLSKTGIELLTNFDRTDLSGTIKSQINFAVDGEKERIDFSPTGTESKMSIRENESEITNNLQLGKDSVVKYGEKASYQPVKNDKNIVIGYDLYFFD